MSNVFVNMADWVVNKVLNSKKRYIVIHGGRGSGKSEGIAQVLLIRSIYENNIRIVCGREIQLSIRDSSKAVIEHWIKQWKVEDQFKITQRSIINIKTGSEFLFYGLSNETKDNITSISNIKYLWIDEAHAITQKTWERVYPSIRGAGAQIFITFNPHKEEDILYKEFINVDREDALVLQVNWVDNPWFKDTPLNSDRLMDLKLKPRALYNHVWEGHLQEYNDNAVIDVNKISYYDLTSNYNYDKIIITLDTAYSTKESADYSAMGAFAKVEDKIHVLNIRRGKWEFHELKTELLTFYQNILSKYKNVDNIIIEDKAAGTSLIQELRRTTHLQITEEKPTKDKYTRVIEVLEVLHTGLFCVPIQNDITTQWVKPYLRELSMFTANNSHDHDDQVDITTMAIKYINTDYIIDYSLLNQYIDNSSKSFY